MLWKPSSPSSTRNPDTVVVVAKFTSSINITMVVLAMMFFFVVAVKLYAISSAT
jgi:hypothetical protein